MRRRASSGRSVRTYRFGLSSGSMNMIWLRSEAREHADPVACFLRDLGPATMNSWSTRNWLYELSAQSAS